MAGLNKGIVYMMTVPYLLIGRHRLLLVPAHAPQGGQSLVAGPLAVASSLPARAWRCPRCHTGKLFTHPALSLRGLMQMPALLPCAGKRHEPEPGFYYGRHVHQLGVFDGGMLRRLASC
ncbi:MAG: hypothetical protein WKG07_29295 [Hymenobacter sp.]